jgi:predicted metal-dependent hydrolase
MPKKLIYDDQVGHVELSKKRGLRSIRLRVDPHGAIKVSVPWMVPSHFAMDFVRSKQDWILAQKQSITPFSPYNGMVLGKNFTLYITELAPSYRSRLGQNKLNVSVVGRLDDTNNAQMEFIRKAMIRTLKHDGEGHLGSRLSQLAQSHGVDYKSIKVKHLTGRWGSCDTHGIITLSLFLTQLPGELIDYVIVHELAHVNHMNHSPKFWKTVENMRPDYKQARKQLRTWQPRLYTNT